MKMITIPPTALLHLAGHVATDPTRPILAGVLFDGAANLAVAADGSTLAVYRLPLGGPGEEAALAGLEGESVILRADWAKMARAAKRARCIVIPVPAVGEVATFQVGTSAFTVEQVEGPYPSWRQVLPKDGSGQDIPALGLNPALLGRFYLAGKAASFLQLTFHGMERAIEVRTSDQDFFGLVMPGKFLGPTDEAIPTWVRAEGTVADLETRVNRKTQALSAALRKMATYSRGGMIPCQSRVTRCS
jgi:hypothetical protein